VQEFLQTANSSVEILTFPLRQSMLNDNSSENCGQTPTLWIGLNNFAAEFSKARGRGRNLLLSSPVSMSPWMESWAGAQQEGWREEKGTERKGRESKGKERKGKEGK